MLDLSGVAAHYAISSFFDGYHSSDSIYAYQTDLQDVRIFESEKLRVAVGTARITSHVTHAQFEFNFSVLHAGGHNLRAGICQTHDDFAEFIEAASDYVSMSDFAGCLCMFDRYFGSEIYSLKSLFRDERHRIVNQIVNSTLEDIDNLYGDVYEQNSALIGFLRDLQMPLPPILRVSSEFVLGNEIRRCLTFEGNDINRVRLLLEKAGQYGISIDSSIKSAFHERLDRVMDRWSRNPLELEALAQLEPLVALARVAPFEADLWRAQNTYYEVMTTVASLKLSHLSVPWLREFWRLGDCLGISVSEPLTGTIVSASLGEKLWSTPTPPAPQTPTITSRSLEIRN